MCIIQYVQTDTGHALPLAHKGAHKVILQGSQSLSQAIPDTPPKKHALQSDTDHIEQAPAASAPAAPALQSDAIAA